MTQPPQPPDRGRRRAKGRKPRSGWIPKWWRRKDKPKPSFLPPLPAHSETGVLARLTSEQLQQRGLDPDKVRPRRKKLASRTFVALVIRWRYFVSSGVALALTISLFALALVGLRDGFNDSDKLPTLTAPTLEELDASIALGQRYITSLYKPLPGGMAVQSEASGVPLRARFPNQGIWVLMGEDKQECSSGECQTTTSIRSVNEGENTDGYNVTFSTPSTRDAFVARVEINWAFRPGQFQIQIEPQAVKEPVELWLDTTRLDNYTPDDQSRTTRQIDSSNQSILRMLRFTIRHATQEAYLYWSTYGRNPERAAALGRFLSSNDFTPGYDMRAPLFDAGDNLPDDLPVNDNAYPDCDRTPAGNELAYAYRSKVCLYEEAYIVSGERDPFLQAWEALTVLMKYNDPNKEQPTSGWWTQGDTPTEVSEHLQGQWNRSGYGIPKCTPFSCAELSGIRTSVFGALETKLGYTYGDADARRFADAAAKVVVQAQVKADGKITADDGKTYYRPGHAGSYLGAWVARDLKFTEPSTPRLPVAIALWVRNAEPTPVEYEGIVPSNSETSLDALGFLHLYRCARYRVGCTG